jgi:hypothetical protein
MKHRAACRDLQNQHQYKQLVCEFHPLSMRCATARRCRGGRAILVNDWALRPGDLEAQIFRQPFPNLGGKTIMHPPRTDPCHVHHGHRSRSRDRDDKP